MTDFWNTVISAFGELGWMLGLALILVGVLVGVVLSSFAFVLASGHLNGMKTEGEAKEERQRRAMAKMTAKAEKKKAKTFPAGIELLSR